MLTAYEKSDNYVITYNSNTPKNFTSHSVLTKNIGSPSAHSDYVSRRRAFNRASAIIYCNKDILNTFITLTYRHQHCSYKKILSDLKNNFSRRGVQYVAVVEKHKSGMYHIHAITSDLEGVISLRKGKYSWKHWKQGFSDVKFISGTDEKFRVQSYIFKYMNKSEKIGGRYILSSRGIKVKKFSYPYGVLPKPLLDNRPLDFETSHTYNKDGYYLTVIRSYYGKNPNKPHTKRNRLN